MPRLVDNAERRTRMARRHAIAPTFRVGSVEDATTAMTVLHATEPHTVYLSLAARIDGVAVEDIDRALYVKRSVAKQLAMRRTMFLFPRDLLPAGWGSASARTFSMESRRLTKNLVDAGLTDDGDQWLAEATDAIEDLLIENGPMSTRDIRAAIPSIDLKVSTAPGTKWGDPTPIAPRILIWMGAAGRIMRGVNHGHWRTSSPIWTTTTDWLGSPAVPTDERSGYAELVRRWLHTFGPGTESDIVWWLGSTKAAVRRALADVGAVEVAIESADPGWVLSDDIDPIEAGEPWAALLPVLDPTTMGWKERDFYLDPEFVPHLFDRNGNAGTTAWWNGQIVGGWVQDEDGVVRVVLLADLGAEARAALEVEAERLTSWLDGVVIASVYKSPLMKGRVP